MKRIIYAILATISGLVLMFSYRTSLEVVTPSSEPAATTTTSSGSGTASSGSSSSGSTSSESTTGSTGSTDSTSSGSTTDSTTDSTTTTTTSTGLTDGTYTGDSVNTRFGPVQVQLTIAGGQISDVQVIDYPNSNGRDRQINERAIPQLVSETIQAQSSQVNMVSGATYTSNGYVTSLQSALDQAQS